MRPTTFARSRVLAPLFLAVFLLGCDGGLVTSPTTDLDVSAIERGDVLYSLADLGTGDAFTATLRLENGADILLRTEGVGDGLARTQIDTGALDVDSITVEYLSDGIAMAPSRTINLSGFLFKEGDEGVTTDDPPSSYHYKRVNGEIVIVQDYTASIASAPSEKQYLGTRGARFQTEGGATAPVTHLQYTLHAKNTPAPSMVMFDTSVDFQLLQSSIQ